MLWATGWCPANCKACVRASAKLEANAAVVVVAPLPSLLQSVQPFTKPCELRLKFLFYIRRHPFRLRKVSDHIGIAPLRFGKGLFGVFPVAHVELVLDNGGERQAHIQVRPDEIKAGSVGLGPESQVFVEQIAHIKIVRRVPNRQRI